MKKFGVLILVLTVFTSCKQKIAYVDTGKVINDVEIKKELEEKFKQKNTVLTQKTDSLQVAFQSEVEKARVSISKMRDETKIQQLYQAIQQKDQGLQRQIQSDQQNLTNDYRTEIDSVISNVKRFVKGYGASNGYDFILGTSDNTASVMYANDASDLTKEITKAFNAKNKK